MIQEGNITHTATRIVIVHLPESKERYHKVTTYCVATGHILKYLTYRYAVFTRLSKAGSVIYKVNVGDSLK